MKEVELKRIGVKSIIKASIIVLGSLGLMTDIISKIILKIIAALSIPTTATGDVISTYVYRVSPNVGGSSTEFVFSILSILHFTIYGIVISIVITLIACFFNFTCNIIGGIKIYIK